MKASRSSGLSRGAALALLAAALDGCTADVLDPQGPVSGAEKMILLDSLAIMLTIIVPVIVGTLAFAWWYRASNPRAKRRPDWAYSGRIELVVWAIPALTIMFLGGVIWISSHQLEPSKPLVSNRKAIEVQAVSLDWKWLFIYPEQNVASLNQLVMPVGTPVHFSLTSASVMNSFFVPKLGSMIYTMNGMATQLNLQADHPGAFHGLSTHFSGDGFPGMHFIAQAVPQAGFDAWVQRARAAGPMLDSPGYAQLAKQSSNVAPYTYRAVAPGLFKAVVTEAIPQAPGPPPKPSPTSPPEPEH